jgi:hypothetical protein
MAFFAAGLRAAVAVRETAGLRDEALRDALAREALLRAVPRDAELLRAVRLAEDFAAVLRALVALRPLDLAVRREDAAVLRLVDALRLAAVLRLVDALRLAAVLRPPALLALAVREPAFLPRLLVREPVFRAMVRYSMRWGRAIGRYEIHDYFTRACSAREHEC